MRAKAWLMTLDSNKPRTTLSWIFLGTLFALCGVLGFLQYREIGEVSTALRQRLRTSLQASLNRFSQDFNSEVRSATRAIAEFGNPFDPKPVETALPVLYSQWKSSTRHPQLFSRIAIAEP